MAVAHLFNSSSVSGPERLVLPALASSSNPYVIINLLEERIGHLRAADPLADYAKSLGLPYRAVVVRSRWDSQAVRDLSALLTELKPTIMHAHAIKASIYLSRATSSGNRSFRTVSTHHGVHGLPDVKTRFYEWLYRKFFLKTFDRVLAVSKADFDFLRKSGIPAEKLRLHLNGANSRDVEPAQRAEVSKGIRAAWLPAESQREALFLFGVVGRLSAEKDHDRLLRVMAVLNKVGATPPWKCLIFGTGALDQELRKRADALGLKDRLVWMGYRDAVGNELAGLDLLLSFSKAEGLPINLVEAGWAGTPVMATGVGGVLDLIPEPRYGTLIPINEPVEKTARTMQTFLMAAGRETLSAQGREYQERIRQEFTQAKWLQKMELIYKDLA